ncbi:hypothetical protein BRAO375_2390056 [Bradyrhizobium sp. ORS 375]|nr:hypothetical protein BRAO375_2390056 [Bradyrhizobium sp. ORS 375]
MAGGICPPACLKHLPWGYGSRLKARTTAEVLVGAFHLTAELKKDHRQAMKIGQATETRDCRPAARRARGMHRSYPS